MTNSILERKEKNEITLNKKARYPRSPFSVEPCIKQSKFSNLHWCFYMGLKMLKETAGTTAWAPFCTQYSNNHIDI